jgi:copper homeostasis protein
LINNSMNIIKEACVEGFIQAYGAEKAGAGRIELCENLAVGGTTPSIGTIKMCKKYMHIPIIAMIRPRGGDFVYSPREIENMAYDIEAFRDAGVDGIAIGILTSKNEVDLNTLSSLLKKAGDMQVTFHKAIDVTENIEAEFLKLCCSGLITRVLTSGGAETAAEGAGMLKKLVEIANERVAVVVAGKVTFENINELSRIIPAREFHGKKIVGDLI